MGRSSLEPAIKYFIFDIGGVLIELKRRHFLVELSRFIRQPLMQLKWPVDHEILKDITCGRRNVVDLFHYLRNAYDCPDDWPAFQRIWQSLLGKTMPGMEEIVQQLWTHYPMVILSNTNEPHFDYLQTNYSIFKYFSPDLLSYQMGLAKPDTRIYDGVLQQLRAEPQDCFLIDDLPENINAAQKMGFRVHHFKNASLLRNKLQYINLL